MKSFLSANLCTVAALGIALSESEAFTFSKNSFIHKTSVGTTSLLKHDSLTPLFAKPKKGKQLVSNIDFDAFDDDEPLSKKDQLLAEKAAKKAAKEAAKKKADEEKELAAKKNSDARAAALAALSNIDLDDDAPMSAKDKKEMEKKMAKEAKKKEKEQEEPVLSKKEKAALKAIEEMERMEQEAAAKSDSEGEPEVKLSKKEQKEAAKKAEKEAAKKAAKEAKRAAQKSETEDIEVPVVAANGEGAPVEETKVKKLTLEQRIRKERPPPRIRVMESSQPNFSALRLENVGITFRDQEVLKDVTWGVQTGDRIGLVGHNGAGKTTQLRIMYGEQEPTTGDVVKSKSDLRVAMLRQEFIDELVPERTLMEEFMSVFEEENKILSDLREAETELEGMTGEDADKMQEVLDRMQKLQNKAETKDVYALTSRAKKVMNLMGFEDDEEDYLVAMFSGGWKMRIGLGKVLLRDPNILLLDEPTNHLDLESVEWLEQFLIEQNIPMVIVSHDREFLDRVCNKIVDAEGGICTEYDGNYSRFLELKKARMDSWNAAYKAQEKKIKEERAWINKFKLKQPQAVKQREAQLEKLLKSEDYIKKPPFVGKPFRFRFPDAPRLSPEVADIKGLSHSYADGANRLFEDAELFIEKYDRIAILGPNGSGKSTLLRLLTGKEKPDSGSAEIVGQNIVMKYFEQNQADALDLDKTVIETVQGASTGQSYNELRALLGQFLFKGDDVEKKVYNLSGGEKARLSLCCMMLEPANLLILDEPTNHLDIPAKEMLEEALQHFDGSVVVVSHDRYFISRVATTIVAVEDKKLVKYQGDYKFYMDKSKALKEKLEDRAVRGVERISSAPVVDLEAMKAQGKKKTFGGAKTAHMVTRKDKGVKNAKRNQAK